MISKTNTLIIDNSIQIIAYTVASMNYLKIVKNIVNTINM